MEADAMTTRSQLCSFGAAVLLATMITVPAGAAPIGGLKQDVTAADRQIDAVHYRDWRHCHWRQGYRYCHGGYVRPYRDYDYYYDDYPYYYGYPGFYGYGFRFGHHHHHHGHHGGYRGRH